MQIPDHFQTPKHKIHFLMNLVRQNDKADRFEADERGNIIDRPMVFFELYNTGVGTGDLFCFELNQIAEKHSDIHPDIGMIENFFSVEEAENLRKGMYSDYMASVTDPIGRPIYDNAEYKEDEDGNVWKKLPSNYTIPEAPHTGVVGVDNSENSD